jgi:hypothetical protein
MSVQQPSQIGTTVESSHESQTFTTNTATTVAHDDNVNLRGNVDISDARELLEAGNAEAVVNDPDDKTSDQLGRRPIAADTLLQHIQSVAPKFVFVDQLADGSQRITLWYPDRLFHISVDLQYASFVFPDD